MIIDCDVHNDWGSAECLIPYIDPNFREYFTRGEQPGPKGAFPHAHRPWLHPEDFRRSDIDPQTDLEHYTVMRDKLLDPYGIDIAILTGEEALEAQTLANPHYSHALVEAYNRWMIDFWLPLDDRFVASLMISASAPHHAAEMIRQYGDHPRIVQVICGSGTYRPLGDPIYHPIWEACSEMNLPLAIHLGAQGGINYNPVANGPVTYYWTLHAMLCQPAMTHVASTIAQGVYEKWPNMKFVIIECGVSWLPSVLWRLDANYKALRKETPWVKRLPSAYARDHIRMTTQPLEQPSNPEWLEQTLTMIDGKNTLMFASDYPHWDFDAPDQIGIPKDWMDNVMWKNQLETFPKIGAYLAQRGLAVAAD